MMMAASSVNLGLMKAAYQQPINISKQLQLQTTRGSPTLMAAAYNPTPITGLTYIPPLNANPTIISPPIPRSRLMAAAVPVLPEYFNWGDLDNVATVKKWPKHSTGYLSPVFDQKTCGSCWAVSSSTVLADRATIWTQGTLSEVSPTFTLACVGDSGLGGDPVVAFANTAGCNGGFPAAAAELFAKKGSVKYTCSDYGWCTGSSECTSNTQVVGGGEGDLNSLIPRCSVQNAKCSENITSKPFTSDSATSHSLTNIQDIKTEILANGPVVAAYVVKQDFYLSMPWTETNGVYVNVEDHSPYSHADPTAVQGFHAVAVVGWGLEKNVKNWLGTGPAKIDIPYWIIRNSWGTSWNADNYVNGGRLHMPGYWKHAMRVKIGDVWLNDNIGIDHMATVNNYTRIGGCTTFDPNVTRVNPGVVSNPVDNSKKAKKLNKKVSRFLSNKNNSGYNDETTDSKPLSYNEASWVVGLAFLCIILLLIILAVYK